MTATLQSYYFKKVSVSSGSFAASPDCVFNFISTSLLLLNNALSTSTTSVIEFSFDGVNLHGELNPQNASVGLAFDTFHTGDVWFRLQSGSSGTVVVSVYSWAR
jgi:hypothetical protein